MQIGEVLTRLVTTPQSQVDYGKHRFVATFESIGLVRDGGGFKKDSKGRHMRQVNLSDVRFKDCKEILFQKLSFEIDMAAVAQIRKTGVSSGESILFDGWFEINFDNQVRYLPEKRHAAITKPSRFRRYCRDVVKGSTSKIKKEAA